MKCEICGGGCAEDSQPKVDSLYRINKFGIDGVWRCKQHLIGVAHLEDEYQLEMFEGKPHFLHSPSCGGYCDYACNPGGFEQVEKYFQ